MTTAHLHPTQPPASCAPECASNFYTGASDGMRFPCDCGAEDEYRAWVAASRSHPAPPPTIAIFGVVCHRVYGEAYLGELGQIVYYGRRLGGRWEARIGRKTADPSEFFSDELAVGTGATLSQACDDCEERLRMRGEAYREAQDQVNLSRSDLMLRYADPSL